MRADRFDRLHRPRFVPSASPSILLSLVVVLAAMVAASPLQARVASLVLPKRSLTPGRTNLDVRRSTSHATICVSGWTATVRPPASYTNQLKVRQMSQYHETGSPSDYEEDHFIPLELGGAPRDPKNLWPEPRSESRHSDPLETTLKAQVCDGTLILVAARRQIVAYKRANG
jgi:hypothetical protein